MHAHTTTAGACRQVQGPVYFVNIQAGTDGDEGITSIEVISKRRYSPLPPHTGIRP